jgi:hypothetical protein
MMEIDMREILKKVKEKATVFIYMQTVMFIRENLKRENIMEKDNFTILN